VPDDLKIECVDAEPRERHNSVANMGVSISKNGGLARRALNRDVAERGALGGRLEAKKRRPGSNRGVWAGAADEAAAPRPEWRGASFGGKGLEAFEAVSIERGMASAAAEPASGSAYLKRRKQEDCVGHGDGARAWLRKMGPCEKVLQLQEVIKKSGYDHGPVDGECSASVTESVKAFHKSKEPGWRMVLPVPQQ